MSGLVGYLRSEFGIKYLEYVLYLFLIGLALFIVKRYVTEYRYSLFSDEIIFEKIVGKRQTPLLVVRVWEIVKTGSIHDDDYDPKSMELFDLTFNKSSAKYILFKHNGEEKLVVYSPSVDFLRQLDRAMSSRIEDLIKEPDLMI